MREKRLAPAACALLLLLTACGQKAQNSPPPHYAILRFENLSGDPSLDWVGRAISESLPHSLAGVLDGPVLSSGSLARLAPSLGPRPVAAPGISTERTEAIGAGANRIVAGYLERNAGEIRISATEEDSTTGRTLRVISASGSSPMAALNQLAHEFSANAKPALTANPEALRDYALAAEAPAGERADLLEKALHLDPDFGQAWVARAGVELTRADRAGVEDVLDRARGRKLDGLSQANLALGEANLKGDRAASIVAMRRVVALSPGDIVLQRALADVETTAGEFGAAASDWKKVTEALPLDGVAWNSLGYARAYAGDYAGALAAFRQYEQLRPKDANPSDSIGDLQYLFGKYTEAAASYLEAHKKQPGFEQFGDLYKAAWAKYRSGDPKGADVLFAQFRSERSKAKDPLIDLLVADWLYRTGRQREAMAALRKLSPEAASAPLHSEALSQLTIWDLLQGDRAQAAKDSAAIGTAVNSAAVFMARFAALPSAPVSEWEMRAEKMVPPAIASLRRLALGYALLLDGKREAAIPVWGELVKSTSATDFFTQAVYAGLTGKKAAHPLLPSASNLNQFAGILDKI